MENYYNWTRGGYVLPIIRLFLQEIKIKGAHYDI